MNILSILKNHKIITGVTIAVLGGISFFAFGGRGEKDPTYTFVPLTRGDVEATISSSGTLNPVTEITVGTQVSGTIEKVLVDFNDKVRKGQIIAVLDSALLQMSVSVAQADSLKAEAQWEEAQFTYARSVQLSSKDLVSESDFQTIKTSLKTAQAGLISARTALQRAVQNLSYSIIRSPITGTVTARNIEAGQTVAASFTTPTLFTIAQDLSKMEITASVDESDIGQIKNGQNVRFTVQAYPEAVFGGVVKQIRLRPTTASNVVNYTVIISAANKDELLLPGMTASVLFVIAHKVDVLLAPNAAFRFQPTDNEKLAVQKRAPTIGPMTAEDSTQSGMNHPAAPENSSAERKSLWYLDDSGHLANAVVLVGITDGSHTEILGVQLPVGKQVISGSDADVVAGSKTQASGGGMRQPMM